MRRIHTIFRLTASRFALPVLVLLTGVGILFQGPAAVAVRPSGDLAAASLVVADATRASAAHPGSGVSTLAPLVDGSVPDGPRHRLAGGSSTCGGRVGSAPREVAPYRSLGAGTSLRATRGCVFGRDALRRSGRLSAPNTAPPTSPF